MSDETVPTLPPEPPPGPAPPPGASTKRRGRTVAVVAVPVVVALVAMAIVFLVIRDRSGASTNASPTPASPSSVVVAVPTSLHAKPGSFRVVITWQPGSGGPTVDQYFVYRDDDLIGVVDAPTHRLVDDEALPHQSYRYAVEAWDLDRNISDRSTLTVKTKTAPMAMARVEGVFDARLTKTSSYGVNGIANKDTAGWRLTPKCETGPCDVTMKDIHFAQLATTLDRTLAAYSGSDTVVGYLRCGSSSSTSSVDVKIHVTDADAVHDAWRATELQGTVTFYNAPQLGCRSSGITYTVTAKLVR